MLAAYGFGPASWSVGRHGGRRSYASHSPTTCSWHLMSRPYGLRLPATTLPTRGAVSSRRCATVRQVPDHRGRSQEHRPLRRGPRGRARPSSSCITSTTTRCVAGSPRRSARTRSPHGHVGAAGTRRRSAMTWSSRRRLARQACAAPSGRWPEAASAPPSGITLATATRVPLVHMYATDATLRVGVSHAPAVAPAVLPDLLAFVARTRSPAERVTTLTAHWGHQPPRTQTPTTKLVLQRDAV